MTVDLDAYFRRIGYTGPAEANLQTLRALHALHAAAIPFENLSALLGEAPALDLASLQAKLLTPGRGGWCFEHNLLFSHVLEALGFEVRRLAARVRWNVPPGVTTSRSHMLMRVMVEGEPRIADVGFGGLTLTAPLRLVLDLAQETPHERHRLVAAGEGLYALEAELAGEWQRLYVFDLQEQLQADYEVSNWYLARHPGSHFVNGLIAARAAPDCRHALRNASYAIHRPGRETQRRTLATLAELRQVLEGPLGLRLPPGAEVDARLAQVLQPR